MKRVISLGAGTQSSAMLILNDQGKMGQRADVAIFADTGDEPDEVYEWLEYLKGLVNIPIIVVKKSEKGLIQEWIDVHVNARNGRASSIPFYTLSEDGEKAALIRQCTYDHKIRMVLQGARHHFGIEGKQTEKIEMLIGISTDEYMRAKVNPNKWVKNVHPLLDHNMDREDCVKLFAKMGLRKPPRSACLYCPYRSDAGWQLMKDQDPETFETACQVDELIRHSVKLRDQLFVHRSRRPLREVDFQDSSNQDQDWFNEECEGMCGV